MSDDDFLEAFEACTIPKEQWTHGAHVRMAWLYLHRNPIDEVIPVVRVAIRRYNASLGNTEGYHETITLAYLALIDHRIARGASEGSFDEFSANHPDLMDRKLSALLGPHYSREVLFSAEAIRDFVEPDLAPLPNPKPGRWSGLA